MSKSMKSSSKKEKAEDLKSPDPVDVYVGKRLRLRRNMLKMSQDYLAEAVHVTFQQIQKYENGSNRISASRLYNISEILNVPISFFFEGLDPQKKTSKGDFKKAEAKGVFLREDGRAFKDPMADTKTLELVNAFWKISDLSSRDKIFDLVRAMSGSLSGDDKQDKDEEK